jgi:hypothetical protein
MNIKEEYDKFKKEYFYQARKTAELAAQHQSAKDTTKALEIKVNELESKLTQ